MRFLPLSPHVMAVLQCHPNAPSKARRQRERMLPAKANGLEEQNLAREMRRREHVCEHAQLVQDRIVDPVRAVHAYDACQDGIHAEETCCERRDLVDWGGFVFGCAGGRRGDQFNGGVCAG